MSLVRLDVRFCRIEDADESDRHVEQSAGKAAELFHERVDRRLDDRQLGEVAKALSLLDAISFIEKPRGTNCPRD